MKKLWFLLLALLALAPAAAQQSTTDLTTTVNTNLPNNTSGAITPAILRSTLIDIIDSYLNTVNLCSPSVAGAFPIYNATSAVWVCSTTGGTGGDAVLAGSMQLVSATATTFLSVGTKIRAVGTAPALTSCGTSPSILGSDLAGTVTMGTATPTSCTITFNAAYVSAPHCVVSWRTNLASMIYSVAASAITLTQTGTNSNVVDYVCMAGSGG